MKNAQKNIEYPFELYYILLENRCYSHQISTDIDDREKKPLII